MEPISPQNTEGTDPTSVPSLEHLVMPSSYPINEKKDSNPSQNACLTISPPKKPDSFCEKFQKKTLFELERECIAFMTAHSFPISKMVTDGSWQRLSMDGGQDLDEWYCASAGISPKGHPWLMCSFGTWVGGLKTLGVYKSWESDPQFSPDEKVEVQKHFSEAQKRVQEKQSEERYAKTRKAREIWEAASEEPTDHARHLEYLSRKKIERHGIRFGMRFFNDGTHESPQWREHPTIIIPLKDHQGEIQAIQHIRGDGKKRFDGPSGGSFHIIGKIEPKSTILVAEGYATAASVFEATLMPTVVAFDCGNLDAVVDTLRKLHPTNPIIICGDDDVETEGNPGRSKAETAAKKYGCEVIFPSFFNDFKFSSNLNDKKRPTDFNDLHVYFGLEEVKSQIDGWPTPIPFDDELLPVDSFDLSTIPLPLRDYVQDCSERIGCPIEFVAVGIIVSFSSILGAGCAIRPHRIDDWTVIPNLWGAVIGIPSSKKSPALNAALLPIAELEKIATKNFEEQKQHSEGNKIEKDTREKLFKKDMEAAVKNENENEINNIKAKLAILGNESSSPILKRYKTNSATVEKLQEILASNPRGILQFNDELMGFLASLEKEGREDSRAFYLESWNGWTPSKFQTDRITRGETQCNPCISVLGGIQPSKLRIYLNNVMKTIGNDGFIQRFQLLVYPDLPKEWKLVDRKPNLSAKEKMIEIAIKIASTNFLEFGAKIEDEFPLPVFRFSEEGQQIFHEWLEKWELRLLHELGDGLVAQHLSKYRKLIPSLSLLNYLCRLAADIQAPRTGVSKDDVENAIRFGNFLETHTRRIYSMVDRRGVMEGKTLLSKICDGELEDGFTLRDVYRPSWSGIPNADEAQEACDELVKRHWIKERKVPIGPSGGRPSIRYGICPNLKTHQKSPAKTDKTKQNEENV